MKEKPILYFKNDFEWRNWLHENHTSFEGVYLIFHKVASELESMRWEEAVKVALCYGWIDSTVKRLDENSRKQLFTPRKDKSAWSKLNKSYIEELLEKELIHESGLKKITIAKSNGSWESLDAVENLEIPSDLLRSFTNNPTAHSNFLNFSKTYKKGYLHWLNQAKREETRQNRILEIILLCEKNIKSR
ncbi:conserved hypothetical protein [Flavobacterium sp. 9AF]|uniref:YdeI/OmpD-associated family protein n=1 Tax=Flavobacterium sp. 9AF TaxID=2653142 RepID=UPI0012EF1452|nr:YdeI/OmpD-associated family protein [Flavobacterium sp. 9AF]VXB51848.1 conserved hypothetical protein [Flavobacterium sp. 9AF]